MKKYKVSDFKKGWIIGDFEPSIFREKNFELAIHRNPKNCETQDHYHAKTKEYNIVISGKVDINGNIFKENDIFVLEENEISRSSFIEDTVLVVLRVPSDPTDKIII